MSSSRTRTFWKLVLLAALLLVALSAALPLNHANPSIAFAGDTLTQEWGFPSANLGIRGQNSSQMLARFSRQISGHGYKQVVLLAGTTDTLQHINPSVTLSNLDAMATIAQKNNIEPVLASVPPIYRDNGKLMPQVQALNARIGQLAAARGLRLVDYYDPLNGHASGYTDGVRLKKTNYWRMEWALHHTLKLF